MLECHAPELCVARTGVLDYFSSPAQKPLAKIMSWEDGFVAAPGKPLVALLRSLCREVALATPTPHVLLCDGLPPTSSLLINLPELAPYRDLAWTGKWMLNPDRSAFPNATTAKVTAVLRRTRIAAQQVRARAR